jgi:UDP:flavonoid glycosyltransferase YjiC (YdhE family)
MKLLLVALGSAGDVYPLVGLGQALRARGHRVTLLANGHFEPFSRQFDLGFHEIAPAADYHALVEKPGLWRPISGFRLVTEWLVLEPMRRTFDAIREKHVPGETMLVAPVSAFGARIAQEALRIPLATICIQPCVFRGAEQPPILKLVPCSPRWPRLWNQAWLWIADQAVIDPLVRSRTDGFRAELGLPPVRRGFGAWSFSPLLVLGMFPEWFARPQPDWPSQVQLAGFPLFDEGQDTDLPPEAVEFLDAGEAPIVFTPGSAMAHGKAFFEAAVRACRSLKARAVLITRYQDQLPPALGSSIRAFSSVPFSRLFPRARLVVHHGGIGTASQALRAGVPHLVLPMAFDQHDNGSRLQRLGVARCLSPSHFAGPAVARAIEQLLSSPEVKDSCARIASRLRSTNGLDNACRMIEEVAAASVTCER